MTLLPGRNAAFLYLDPKTGQQLILRLPAPLRGLRPVSRQRRYVETSLDYSTTNIITLGDPVWDLAARIRYHDVPDELLYMLTAGAGGATLTYVPDLSRPGPEYEALLLWTEDAIELGLDADMGIVGRYEVTVLLRRTEPWGGALAPRDVLFRYHAGSPGLSTERATAATYRDRAGVIQTVPEGALRVTWVGGRPYALIEPEGGNLILDSEDLEGAGWTKNTGGRSPVSLDPGVIAPDGESRMTVVDLSGDTTRRYAAATGVDPAGRTYTLSFWGRVPDGAANERDVQVRLRAASNVGEQSDNYLSTSEMDGRTRRYHLTHTFDPDPGGSDLSVVLNKQTSPEEQVGRIEIWGVQVREGAVPDSYTPTDGKADTRDQDLVQTDYAYPPMSVAVYEAGVEAGAAAVGDARMWQFGAGVVASGQRDFKLWRHGGRPAMGLAIGNGDERATVYMDSVPDLGASYERLAKLGVDMVEMEARVQLIQRVEQSDGSWATENSGWSDPIDATALLARGYESPHLTIGNVYEGTRPGRLILSDFVVLRGHHHHLEALSRRFAR